MTTLQKRILSAVVLAQLVLAAVAYGGWAFYLLMAAVFGISLQEWSRLSLRDGRISWKLLGAGVAYLALACLSAVWLRNFEDWGFYLILYVLFAVWACDVGAYVAGKTIGGPKMAPKVSPNKTWAGLAGGCIAAVATVVLYTMWLETRLATPVIERFSLFFQCTLGLLLAVVGQLGDLMISVLKRKCGLKDTGNIIPGHGGLLDRIDALLLTMPAYTIVIFYLDHLIHP